MNLSTEISYQRGHTVYTEKEPNDFVYVVESGEFELSKALPRKNSIMLEKQSDQENAV